jgi:hypothetical protein
MNITEAKRHLAGELARIERENPDKELRPWMRDACPAASEHWGKVQQRIALDRNDYKRECLKGLDIAPPERTVAQKMAAGRLTKVRLGRLAA